MKKILWCIISIIIFIICINILVNSYKIYNLNKYIAEMDIIQEKVYFFRDEYKNWENYNPNETGNFYNYMQISNFINANSQSDLYVDDLEEIINKLNNEKRDCWNSNIDSIITNYCYFSSENLEEKFGIENCKFDVIINFYTGNVISKIGMKDIDNKIIYRQYDSKLGKKLQINEVYYNEIIPSLDIVENNGLTQKVKISLNSDYNISEIYYYLDENEKKYKCSNLYDYNYVEKENTAYFTIDKSGNYKFIVQDTNSVQYPEIEKDFELCNPPVLVGDMKGIYWTNDEEKEIENLSDGKWYDYSSNNLKMANAKTDDGNYWVWIPRFFYKNQNQDVDIKFATETSNTSTNNKSIIGYKLQEAFSENGEIVGFWISKFQSSNENKLESVPGKALSVINKIKASSICEKYGNESMLPTQNQLNSILMISNFENIKISNDLIHYSGGGPNELDYRENVKYSSTNNIYGVYDLITSENELVKEQSDNTNGRYRTVIISK